MTVKVVTDSTADLPPALAKELGIAVIPLNVLFGTQVYRDGVDISGNEFYQRLMASPRLPTTSQPSVGSFLELYQELGETTDQVISVHISSKLSGTLNSATLAREQYRGACRIEIVDSQQACMGLGLIAVAAARAARQGASLDEVVKETQRAIHQVRFFGLLDTLEYLEKGGRIGKAQAFVGSLLHIKPILMVRDGECQPLERARTRGKGIERLCELAQEHMPLEDLAVVYTTTREEAEALARRLQPCLPKAEVILSQVGLVVGTYLGPGVMGIALRRETAGSL
ncbi:MAG: Fatty acid-binding protein DegV [Dehalococcoidia bacterium]|nr:Fatty acid-binding protein DegV [Dehalococcoidia bacterium]